MNNSYLSNNKLDVRAVLLWACFLGSSWTWMIGMFLPVLLMRDYGLAGWIIFAIPNVVGAALMGFVIPSAAASKRIVKQHKQIAQLFSKVTIALQIFTGIWILYLLIGSSAVVAGAVIAFGVLQASKSGNSAILKTSLVITIISIGLFIYWLFFSKLGWSVLDIEQAPKLTTTDLALFAPASFLGFMLCPYLDLTFHKARQNTNSKTGKAAFTIGFGVIFAAMIVFAMLYSSQLGKQILTNHSGISWLTIGGAFVIGLQLLFQAGFTTGIHLHEVTKPAQSKGKKTISLFIISAIALSIWAIMGNSTDMFGLRVGEIIYRCFIIFYGLVFPAYVWLVMIPTRKPTSLNKSKIVWIIATLICLPMAFLFIVLQYPWQIVGMLGVLALAKIYLEIAPKKEH